MKDIGIVVKEINNEFGQFCGGKACDHCKYDGADECKVAFAYDRGRVDAIDEFVAFANTLPFVVEEDGHIRPMRLKEMAEQMKEKGNEYKADTPLR